MRMRIDIDAIEVIDAIVKYGSFAKAAEKLHKVRSALTYTVKKLEEELGVILFDRTGHRAQLTEAGEKFLEQGRIILLQCFQLEERLKAIEGGWEEKLQISYNDLIPIEYLFPIIREFQIACPYTQLTLSAERLNGTIDSITSGQASLCIGASRDVPEGSDYDCFQMPAINFVFAISPDHPLASADEPLSNDDIIQYPSVSATDTTRFLLPRTVGILSGQKVLRVDSIESKKRAQMAGLGVGYLPEPFIQAELTAGTLIVKKVGKPKPSLPLTVLWRIWPQGKAMTWLIDRLRNDTFSYLEPS